MDTSLSALLLWTLFLGTFDLETVQPAVLGASRCTWRSSVSATLPENQTVIPEKSCQSGQLLWHNPRGSLLAQFGEHGTDPVFSLCLQVVGDNDTLAGVYNETGQVSLPIWSAGIGDAPVCVDSIDGEVSIRFEATDTLETLASVDYFKQPP